MTIIKLLFKKELKHFFLRLEVTREDFIGERKRLFGDFTCDVLFNYHLINTARRTVLNKLGQCKRIIIQRLHDKLVHQKVDATSSYYLLTTDKPRYNLLVKDLYLREILESSVLFLGTTEISLTRKEKRYLLRFQKTFIATVIACIFSAQFYAFARHAGIMTLRDVSETFPLYLIQKFLKNPRDVTYGEICATSLAHEKRKCEMGGHSIVDFSIVMSTEYRNDQDYQMLYIYYKKNPIYL